MLDNYFAWLKDLYHGRKSIFTDVSETAGGVAVASTNIASGTLVASGLKNDDIITIVGISRISSSTQYINSITMKFSDLNTAAPFPKFNLSSASYEFTLARNADKIYASRDTQILNANANVNKLVVYKH